MTQVAHVAGSGYLLAARPGGTCPKAVGTCWRRQPASPKWWDEKAPTPACPDRGAGSAPDWWAAAALDRTNATASPEHTHTEIAEEWVAGFLALNLTSKQQKLPFPLLHKLSLSLYNLIFAVSLSETTHCAV